jgi:transposase
MGSAGEREAGVAGKYAALSAFLDERQRRLWMGAEAREWGHGGVAAVARATGASRSTVSRGVDELESGVAPDGRARRRGGGRKRAEDSDPALAEALEALVAPESRGDPQSPLRWTAKSTRDLAQALTERGHQASDWLVRRMLRAAGYSLQGNAKTAEGRQHPDRDAQFGYLNEQASAAIAAGQPVISVDAKKKELVGQFKNGGREWQPQGRPEQVNVHDFKDPRWGKAIPYGIYDLAANTGWVSVGRDHDTAAFAVQSIRTWWKAMGQARYPGATRLLISADGGGSNGYRVRAWKAELAQLAAQTGLQITVCHLPPGTSKWNKIEHRLFSQITMNWRGRPLTSHQVIIELIAATRTRTGLTVHAEPDTAAYPLGTRITDRQMRALEKQAITRHDWHGEWNYTLHPTPR